MISLSATTYDPDGTVIVHRPATNPYQGQRRGSVTETLDGGVSVYDGGYSITDQTLKYTVRYPSRALLDSLRYLVAYYGQVIACCEIGAFSGVLSFSLTGSSLTVQLRPTSRLDT